MTLPKHIIIVEDEVITQRYLRDILSQYEVEVTACFSNAKNTLEGLKEIPCDMLLMDINIDGSTDGIQLARQILEKYTLPIVFITAHNDDETLEEILELAPYGFITKPFSSKEVVINIQIAYKRYLTHTQAQNTVEKLDMCDIVINKKYTYSKKLSEVYEGNYSVKFNQKQYLLIGLLVKNINQTVSYEVLVRGIWGGDDVADSALRTLVYSVRKIVPDFPIISYSKMGYMLSSKEEGTHD
jgi:DNA-binding response OmpR family regulator